MTRPTAEVSAAVHNNHFGTAAALVGGYSELFYSWAFSDMPGISVIIAVLTVALSIIKLHESWICYRERRAKESLALKVPAE